MQEKHVTFELAGWLASSPPRLLRHIAFVSMEELQTVLSDLLSLRASSSQLNTSLERLRGVLTAIALETGLRDGSSITKAGFLQLQESFLHNGELYRCGDAAILHWSGQHADFTYSTFV